MQSWSGDADFEVLVSNGWEGKGSTPELRMRRGGSAGLRVCEHDQPNSALPSPPEFGSLVSSCMQARMYVRLPEVRMEGGKVSIGPGCSPHTSGAGSGRAFRVCRVGDRWWGTPAVGASVTP